MKLESEWLALTQMMELVLEEGVKGCHRPCSSSSRSSTHIEQACLFSLILCGD